MTMPHNWEWVQDSQSKTSVLITQEIDGTVKMGYNVPPPNSPVFEEARDRLQPYVIPEGKKFNKWLAFDILTEKLNAEIP